MQRIVFLSLSGLLVAAVTLAEDFWQKKEYVQWTDEEVRKVMTDSPWAKDITVSVPIGILGTGAQRAALENDSSTDTGGGRGGRTRRSAASGGSAGTGGDALLTLNISWRSALPFRKALVRSRLGSASAIPPEGQQLISNDQQDYVVVVTGVPANMAAAIQNPGALDKTTLRAGKKPPIAARSMDLQRRTQTVDIIYMFPKTQPITTEDKEVEVVLNLGQIEAKRKFSLKEMVYNGKLEL
jgi:hypothetical protein